jgi:hypothetical protein
MSYVVFMKLERKGIRHLSPALSFTIPTTRNGVKERRNKKKEDKTPLHLLPRILVLSLGQDSGVEEESNPKTEDIW